MRAAERKREEKRLGIKPMPEAEPEPESESSEDTESEIDTWEEGDFDADFGPGGGRTEYQ